MRRISTVSKDLFETIGPYIVEFQSDASAAPPPPVGMYQTDFVEREFEFDFLDTLAARETPASLKEFGYVKQNRIKNLATHKLVTIDGDRVSITKAGKTWLDGFQDSQRHVLGALNIEPTSLIKYAAMESITEGKLGTRFARGGLSKQVSLDMIAALRDNTNFQETAKVKLPEKPKYIGGGTRGHAWDIGNKKVLKVTYDGTEAKASSVLIGKKMPNLIKIYGVYRHDDIPNRWFIVMEQVKVSTDGDIRSDFEDICLGDFNDWLDDDDATEHLGFVQNPIREPVESLTWDDKTLHAFESFFIYHGHALDSDAFQIAQGLNSLNKLGISWRDLHEGNIGYRGKELVLFDFGYSDSGSGTIKEIE